MTTRLAWSVALGLLAVVFAAQVEAQLSGTYRIANGNPNGVFDYGDIGDAFDDIENNGINGPVILEIYDDGGTFTSSASYSLSYTGATSTNTITIRAAQGETPVINGSAAVTNATTGTLGIDRTSYVTVEGLELTGGGDYGFKAYAEGGVTTDLTVRRLTVHGVTNGPGIFIYEPGFSVPGYDNVTIENCMIYDCWSSAASSNMISSYASAILAFRRPKDNVFVRHNTVLNNTSVSGIGAIGITGATGTWQIDDLSHNIFMSTSAGSFAINQPAGYEPAAGDYNIYHVSGTAAFHSDTATYANLGAWQTANTSIDQSSVDTDPNLTSTTAGSEDLHLSASSTNAIDAATGSTTTLDNEGESRPSGASSDIGADEDQPVAVPSILTTAPSTGTAGIQYIYYIGLSWNHQSTLSLGSAAPAWLTLSGNTLYGTPTAGGTYGPFDLTATATAGSDTETITIVVAAAAPEIDILDSDSNSVASGGTVDVFGTVDGVTTSGTFTIDNSAGTGDLNLTGTPLVDQGTTASNCTVVITQPTTNPITAGNSDTFDVDVDPNGAGAWSVTLTILNDDSDEGTYTITLQGTAQATAAPEIGVLDPDDNPVASGGSYSINNTGTAMFNSAWIVRNEGAAQLDLTGMTGAVVVTGTPSNCTVTVNQPASTALAAASGGATEEAFSFDVTPIAAGTFSFTFEIVSNDADEGTFTITFDGDTDTGSSGGGSTGGGGGGDGGCSTGGDSPFSWMVLAAALSSLVLATRLRNSRA